METETSRRQRMRWTMPSQGIERRVFTMTETSSHFGRPTAITDEAFQTIQMEEMVIDENQEEDAFKASILKRRRVSRVV